MAEPVTKLPIPTSAEEARKIGSVVYFSGKSCPNGHIAQRYTSCHKCVECNKSEESKTNNKIWYKEKGHIKNGRRK